MTAVELWSMYLDVSRYLVAKNPKKSVRTCLPRRFWDFQMKRPGGPCCQKGMGGALAAMVLPAASGYHATGTSPKLGPSTRGNLSASTCMVEKPLHHAEKTEIWNFKKDIWKMILPPFFAGCNASGFMPFSGIESLDIYIMVVKHQCESSIQLADKKSQDDMTCLRKFWIDNCKKNRMVDKKRNP